MRVKFAVAIHDVLALSWVVSAFLPDGIRPLQGDFATRIGFSRKFFPETLKVLDTGIGARKLRTVWTEACRLIVVISDGLGHNRLAKVSFAFFVFCRKQ
jgi:hypothetical protein